MIVNEVSGGADADGRRGQFEAGPEGPGMPEDGRQRKAELK